MPPALTPTKCVVNNTTGPPRYGTRCSMPSIRTKRTMSSRLPHQHTVSSKAARPKARKCRLSSTLRAASSSSGKHKRRLVAPMWRRSRANTKSAAPSISPAWPRTRSGKRRQSSQSNAMPNCFIVASPMARLRRHKPGATDSSKDTVQVADAQNSPKLD